jgi:chitinase
LKKTNTNLKTYISVGGGAVGGKSFSTMAASAANRATFIASAIQFMTAWNFDGIDIDWEYPVSTDTNGSPADFANFVLLMKELRAAIGTRGLTITIPTTYYYMQYYDLKGMEPYVDWFNVMAYDLQGAWDVPALVWAHTNLSDIDSGLTSIWSAGVSPSKVVLGLALYGRSFTLANTACVTPGCPFSNVGTGGCVLSEGMSAYEVKKTIAQYGITPVLDKNAAVKYFAYGSNQWIAYDDSDTFKLKLAYANSMCLGGTSKSLTEVMSLYL